MQLALDLGCGDFGFRTVAPPQTGVDASAPPPVLSLDQVYHRLSAAFGPFRRGRPAPAPAELLVHALLVELDPTIDAGAVAERLTAAFGGWSGVAAAGPEAVAPRLAGLRFKSPAGGALAAARVLCAGLQTLERARALSPEDLLRRLMDAGLSVAVASGVLALSSLQYKALALNAGVLRVTRRLGLLADDAAALALGLPSAWSAADAWEAHWLLRRLAETRCGPERPRCGACPLRDGCATAAAELARPSRPAETRGFRPGARCAVVH